MGEHLRMYICTHIAGRSFRAEFTTPTFQRSVYTVATLRVTWFYVVSQLWSETQKLGNRRSKKSGILEPGAKTELRHLCSLYQANCFTAIADHGHEGTNCKCFGFHTQIYVLLCSVCGSGLHHMYFETNERS